LANYYNEINKMLDKILLKIFIHDMEGFKLGAGSEDFSFLEFQVLRKIGHHRKKTVDLADELKISRAAITTMVKRLISKGYLTRKQSEGDRRVSYFQLTEPGKEMVLKSYRIQKQLMDFILADISVNEERTILKFLSKINQASSLNQTIEADKK